MPDETSLRVRLTQEEYEQFVNEAFRRGRIKHQAALKEAVRLWLSAGSVPIPEQAITCPSCNSLIPVSAKTPPEVMGPISVLKSEQPQSKAFDNVPSERERIWAELATRAVNVRDPEWQRMLRNIQIQLEQVAEIADREQEDSGSDIQGGGGSGVDISGAGGKGGERPAGNNRRKAR
jgi:hypothetical protein